MACKGNFPLPLHGNGVSLGMVSTEKQSLDHILISYTQAKLFGKIKPNTEAVIALRPYGAPINWGDTQLMQF